METINVYKCSECGKISEKKATIIRCENKHAKEKEKVKEQAARQKIIKKAAEKILTAENVEQIEKYFIEYCSLRKIFFKGFSLDVKFSEAVSCSHSAPIGKQSVWDTRNNTENLPTHYPALKGRVSYSIDYEKSGRDSFSFSSDVFRGTAIHTGSGGGGLNCQYDVTIWVDDYPNIKKSVEESKECSNLVEEIYNNFAQYCSNVTNSDGILWTLSEVKKAHNAEIMELQNKIREIDSAYNSHYTEAIRPLKEKCIELQKPLIDKCVFYKPKGVIM